MIGLLARVELAIAPGGLLPLCRFVALLTSLGDVDVLEANRLVDQNGDTVGQSLHESFARCEFETRAIFLFRTTFARKTPGFKAARKGA